MDTECIEWQGAKDANGYGRLTIQQVQLYAHRWTWEQAFGAVPEGLCVCHTCDNPSCINLDHLWLGTHAENMADAKRKHRSRGGGAHGEAQHLAKLTEADVRDIRTSSETQVELARRYGVSQGTISNVILRKTWRHVA
jgi:hypothetical protein